MLGKLHFRTISFCVTFAALTCARPHCAQEAPKSAESAANDRLQREYARLAQLLNSDDAAGQREAIESLQRVRPSDVVSPDTKKLIARGYRSIAAAGFGTHQDEAIQGLVIWGGKYSVPVLIDLIDKEKVKVNDALFSALGDLKDPRGAEAAARHLGNFFNHENAVTSLRKMGTAAEDALISAAPSDNADVSLAAVQLLGEVGGDKSIAILQKASQARNPAIKQAARDAIKQVRLRQKTGNATQKPDTIDLDSPFADGAGPPVDIVARAARGRKDDRGLAPPPDVSGNIEANMLKLFRDGIDAQKNAAVPLWQAMWPGEIEPTDYEFVWRELGLSQAPSETNALKPIPDESNRQTWLSENKLMLDLIVKAAELPHFYSPSPSLLNNEDEPLIAMLLPGVRMLQNAAKALALRGEWQLNQENHNEAWQDILAIHRLARLLSQGPTLIEQLAAMKIDGLACGATTSLVSDKNTPAEVLRQVDRDLAGLAEFTGVARAIDSVERAIYFDSIARLRKGDIRGWKELLGLTDAIVNVVHLPTAWTIVTQRGQQHFDELARVAGMPPGPARREAIARLNSEYKRMEDHSRQELPEIAGLDERQRAAYRAARGNYPERLGDLVPSILKKLPVDVYNEKLLVYRRTNDGYLLYTIGENGNDDGGSNERTKSADDIAIRVPTPPTQKPN